MVFVFLRPPVPRSTDSAIRARPGGKTAARSCASPPRSRDGTEQKILTLAPESDRRKAGKQSGTLKSKETLYRWFTRLTKRLSERQLIMILAEVVGVQADEAYIDLATGRFCLERADPIVYSHGEYFALGEALGHFGWSVRKKKKAPKRR